MIPPGGVGVLIYEHHIVGFWAKFGGAISTLGKVPFSHIEGYLSVNVRSPEKIYTVFCGFLVGWGITQKNQDL